jgi:hypothetical protein
MTLKEKILSDNYLEDYDTPITDYQADNIVERADDYAIGFAEWFTNEKSKYAIMYGNQEKRFSTFKKDYTAKELLEIYKKEKGL